MQPGVAKAPAEEALEKLFEIPYGSNLERRRPAVYTDQARKVEKVRRTKTQRALSAEGRQMLQSRLQVFAAKLYGRNKDTAKRESLRRSEVVVLLIAELILRW